MVGKCFFSPLNKNIFIFKTYFIIGVEMMIVHYFQQLMSRLKNILNCSYNVTNQISSRCYSSGFFPVLCVTTRKLITHATTYQTQNTKIALTKISLHSYHTYTFYLKDVHL